MFNLKFKSVITMDGDSEVIDNKMKCDVHDDKINFMTEIGNVEVMNYIEWTKKTIKIERGNTNINLSLNKASMNVVSTEFGDIEVTTKLNSLEATKNSLKFDYDLLADEVKQNFLISLNWK